MKTYTIGRGVDAMIQCGDDTVGRIHAEITVTDDGRYYLADRASLNGTFVLNKNRWQPLTKSYVTANTVFLLGEFRTTVSQLLALASPNVKPALQPKPYPAAPKRIMRNPETGEIIKI